MIGIMSSDMVLAMLVGSHQRLRPLGPGEFLFRRGNRVTHFFIVMEGAVELVRLHPNGSAVVLQRAVNGSLLAEASIYAERYHCDAIATATSSIAVFDMQALHKRLRSDPGFSEAWSTHLATEVRNARARGELLSLRTVGARLDAWLILNDGKLPNKGTWKSVAAQIGVSPEAFYREIAKRGL
jgi:CRP/FNR family transcriptional regulator, dissimilatory nitrate respiration regulator